MLAPDAYEENRLRAGAAVPKCLAIVRECTTEIDREYRLKMAWIRLISGGFQKYWQQYISGGHEPVPCIRTAARYCSGVGSARPH